MFVKISQAATSSVLAFITIWLNNLLLAFEIPAAFVS
jgi:hypothetical protein